MTASPAELAAQLGAARRTTLALVDDLAEPRWRVPRLAIVNPPLWEIGHVGWFQEFWVLRHLRGEAPIRADGDSLYDSARVAHETRWDLPLPPPALTREFLARVLERVLEGLERRRGGELDAPAAYFHHLALFHEDMHAEALAYTRQTLAYPAPRLPVTVPLPPGAPLPGDVEVAGGAFTLGMRPGRLPFVFDNEQWAHEVELPPFRIARAPVTQAAFAEFVRDGGYRREDLWSPAGWRWREQARAAHPVYWIPQAEGAFAVRRFDRVIDLAPHEPVHQVCWYEAEAWCNWAGRRLPSEAEWERAAAGVPRDALFPWGDAAPAPGRANLGGAAGGPLPVQACAEGDSAAGCRQMIGNVWEWTADDFAPYPGFAPGPYREYSAPWFGSHKVLRGGSWFTPARLIRNTWRNFYTPDRGDVWAGFRTCAR